MFRYRGFSLTIDSELELPSFPRAEGSPDVVIRFGKVPRVGPRVTMDEQVACNTIAGMFQISRGKEIVMDPLPGIKEETLRVLVTGRMMAFLLRQRGWLPLHGSGVAIGQRTVLFLGQPGAGKSTMAGSLYARGHDVIADDVAAVRLTSDDRCVMLRAGSFIRLANDSAVAFQALKHVPPGRFDWDKYVFDLRRQERNAPRPVGRIYVLEYGESDRLEAVHPTAAVALLSMHSFAKRHRMDRPALQAHLRDCTLIADKVPVFRLIRRESMMDLDAAARLVEGDLAYRSGE